MAVKNSITKTGGERLSLANYLNMDAVKINIANVVGEQNSQRFISSIISAVTVNPALRECTYPSIINAALLGETLKLSPSPQLGYFYFVPFKNTKEGVTEAQFQLGYKGYIQLAIRTGVYKKLNVLPIKEGELVSFDPINEEIVVNLIDDEDVRNAAPTIGYYGMFEYMNGFRKAIYWSKKKMESHANKYSKGYQARKGFTFWEKDFDGMACKTILRQLLSKWGVMSIDMQMAYEADQSVIMDDGTKKYVDNDDSIIEAEAREVTTPPETKTAEEVLFE